MVNKLSPQNRNTATSDLNLGGRRDRHRQIDRQAYIKLTFTTADIFEIRRI